MRERGDEEKLRQAFQALLRITEWSDDDREMYEALRPHLEWINVPGGDYLFRQGEEGNAMYILTSGRLQVLATHEGKVEVRGEIPAGNVVGEMALLTGEARNADIRALRDCVLAKLDKVLFEETARRNPAVLFGLTRTIVARLQRRQTQSQRPQKRITNVCLLPLSPTVDGMSAAEALLSVLPGSVALSSASVDAALGEEQAQVDREDATYSHLAGWLEEMEARHRFLLFVPDRDDTEWTRRCLRLADEILLLGDAAASPALHPLEKAYLHGEKSLSRAVQTLVLLHDDKTKIPKGTAAWRQLRPVALHHHVRRNTVTDWARLGRFLSGTATGLVLSGGAAKGIAHIGVIRALEEAGIPIDFLGGTSMGALMGAGRAHDWSGEKMRQVARPVFLSKPTSDLNLFPRVSLFKGAKMESVLQKLFGETQIEDLWLNFFAVSCNLTQKRPHIHRTGRLGDALRASISIPGAFPPKTIGGERFVDGGVFNNMPIDVMATFGVGTLMAVDLRDYDSAQKPSTGLLSVIVEASMVAGQYLAAQNSPQVDLLFNPPTGGVGMLEWGKFDTIEQVGYEHAREVLLNSYPKPTQS